jgi:lipoyl(octanoyl) transferase
MFENLVIWHDSLALEVPYQTAISEMEAQVAAIHDGSAPERVWLLQHPPLYTAGTSANPADLLTPDRFPVIATGRGGQYTYHGPGQAVGYVMMDLTQRGSDVRRYVHDLEEWLIRSLSLLGVQGERREGRVGIWVRRDEPEPREDKIAAIGVRVRRWVSYHGVSLNVAPDLEHFSGIVPCGIEEHGVTSLANLGIDATLEDAGAAMREAFESVFGRKTTEKTDYSVGR